MNQDKFIVVNGRLYTVPYANLVSRPAVPVHVSFEKFKKITGTANVPLCIDSFMGQCDVGPRGYPTSSIEVVETKHGFVWVSSVTTDVPDEEMKACGLQTSTVGARFLFAWYGAKAQHAYESSCERFRNDGVQRALLEFPPARVVSPVPLCPTTIKGSREISPSSLSREERFFFMQIRENKSLAMPRFTGDDFVLRVRNSIETSRANTALLLGKRTMTKISSEAPYGAGSNAYKFAARSSVNKRKFLLKRTIEGTIQESVAASALSSEL